MFKKDDVVIGKTNGLVVLVLDVPHTSESWFFGKVLEDKNGNSANVEKECAPFKTDEYAHIFKAGDIVVGKSTGLVVLVLEGPRTSNCFFSGRVLEVGNCQESHVGEESTGFNAYAFTLKQELKVNRNARNDDPALLAAKAAAEFSQRIGGTKSRKPRRKAAVRIAPVARRDVHGEFIAENLQEGKEILLYDQSALEELAKLVRDAVIAEITKDNIVSITGAVIKRARRLDLSAVVSKATKGQKRLSARQERWVSNMCKWDKVSRTHVLETYNIPDTNTLTKCGVSACGGCSVCGNKKDYHREFCEGYHAKI